MRITLPRAGVMIALALLTVSVSARQQTPGKKPVPTFTDEDSPAGSAVRSTSADGSADSWNRSIAAWPRLKSLRARMTIDSPNGRVEALLEAVQPDRFHMAARNGMEFITIGNTTYMKAGGAAWERMEGNSSQAFSSKGLMNGDAVLQGGHGTLVGAEKIDGIDTDVYDVTSAIGQAGTVRVWIGTSDGLPRKLTGSIGSAISISVNFYDFNKDDISVRAPM